MYYKHLLKFNDFNVINAEITEQLCQPWRVIKERSNFLAAPVDLLRVSDNSAEEMDKPETGVPARLDAWTVLDCPQKLEKTKKKTKFLHPQSFK